MMCNYKQNTRLDTLNVLIMNSNGILVVESVGFAADFQLKMSTLILGSTQLSRT